MQSYSAGFFAFSKLLLLVLSETPETLNKKGLSGNTNMLVFIEPYVLVAYSADSWLMVRLQATNVILSK